MRQALGAVGSEATGTGIHNRTVPSRNTDASVGRQSRRARGHASREKIAAAAAKLIARHGIAGLRIEEVAASAGVSTPLVYYHFADRSTLISAAFEFASARMPSAILKVASDGRAGYDALESALLGELDDRAAVRDYAVVWSEVTSHAAFDQSLRPAVRHITNAWQATVEGAIRRGIADSSIRTDIDPSETAAVLILLVDALCSRWIAGSIELARARELLGRELSRLRSAAAAQAR